MNLSSLSHGYLVFCLSNKILIKVSLLSPCPLEALSQGDSALAMGGIAGHCRLKVGPISWVIYQPCSILKFKIFNLLPPKKNSTKEFML